MKRTISTGFFKGYINYFLDGVLKSYNFEAKSAYEVQRLKATFQQEKYKYVGSMVISDCNPEAGNISSRLQAPTVAIFDNRQQRSLNRLYTLI